MKKFLSIFALVFFVGTLGNADYKKLDSPFLGSTSHFKYDKVHKDLLVFRNPNKRTVDYKKVIFDPVLIYQSPNSREKQLSEDEILTLGAEFKRLIEGKFGDLVQIVNEPGAGILRVRFAIRGLKQGNYYMDSSGDHRIKPDSRLAAATLEMEGIDSLTGERVVALVQNLGSENIGKIEKGETLRTVQTVFSDWVDMLKSVYLEKIILSTIPK